VHSTGIQDRVAARAVLMRLFCLFAAIETVFVDGGYTDALGAVISIASLSWLN